MLLKAQNPSTNYFNNNQGNQGGQIKNEDIVQILMSKGGYGNLQRQGVNNYRAGNIYLDSNGKPILR